jgi:hypothetical protein
LQEIEALLRKIGNPYKVQEIEALLRKIGNPYQVQEIEALLHKIGNPYQVQEIEALIHKIGNPYNNQLMLTNRNGGGLALASEAYSQPPTAMNVHRKRKRFEDRYVIDSGCSNTIVMNNAHLENYTVLPTPITMKGASGADLKCLGKCDLKLNTYVTIRNALYCPQVELNLVSTAQICDQGFTIKIHKSAIDVYRSKPLC